MFRAANSLIGADSYLRGNAPKDKRTVQGY